jgi:crotonobetainyl-CoA:carnitine CoA-transferase CaiB-like acyl-CoA transferase
LPALIDRMDVLVGNFRPGAMDRPGLSYDALPRRNPRLVFCSISGCGQNGPSRNDAASGNLLESVMFRHHRFFEIPMEM